MRAIRVNESVSRLNAALRGHLHAEFWREVDQVYLPTSQTWPIRFLNDLLAAVAQWRADVGSIDEVARTYACIVHDGKPHLVLQITYARVRQETVSLPSSGEAGGGRQVDAEAAPARTDSQTENDDEGRG